MGFGILSPPGAGGTPPPSAVGRNRIPFPNQGGEPEAICAQREITFSNLLQKEIVSKRFPPFAAGFVFASHWLPEALISCAGRVGRPIDSAENLGPLRFRAPTLPSRDKSRTIAVCRVPTQRALS